ncbi:DUF4406 domain-containing protein [Zobellella denitrificans]|uniref:DUF4406 domain-containing protein n=1 Tax=Zobellella denitrificans TaxID=347534 RepID=UPI000BBE9D38|nr:DUF4406 domain-containing protein [Zobellella denitrificans]
MTNARRIYIAGPISGAGPNALDRFHQAATQLAAPDVVVLNPATLPPGLQEHQYMDICLAMLRTATDLALLDAWHLSLGAQVEYHYARKLGLPIWRYRHPGELVPKHGSLGDHTKVLNYGGSSPSQRSFIDGGIVPADVFIWGSES